MKIIEIKRIENCLEGKNVWDILFDTSISTSLLGHLGNLGKVIIHDFHPKPYFKLIVRGKFTLQGSIGNSSARVLIPDDGGTVQIEVIRHYVEQFSS